MSRAVPCWLVVRYRSFYERWLHAICTTVDSANARRMAVQSWCDHGDAGCKPDDRVVVEESQLDHLLGECMFGRRQYGTLRDRAEAEGGAK